MDFLIIALLSLGGLIALLLFIALFVKKNYSVERELVIHEPRAQIFTYIKYLKNQDNFSKWARMDPNMKKTYSGTDGQPGFISAWESDQKSVGKGEQEIKSIREGDRIIYEIRFIKPFPGVSKAQIELESLADNQTLVKWGFSSGMKYPMNLFLLFMNIEKVIGRDLHEGLTNLKKLMEQH